MKKLLRKIYKAVPLKRQAFNLLKKVWLPSEKVYRHLHFQGEFKVEVEKNAWFKMRHYGFLIENEVFWEGLDGGFEHVSYKLWKKLVGGSKVIFDIGANTGLYSLIANSLNSEADIYAFEPVERVFEKLETNRLLNNFGFHSIKKALSNFEGEASIFEPFDEHVYSVTVNKNLNSAEISVIETKIDVERLDDFIERKYIKRVDLMKIDVETHEPEVLEGMGKYLEQFAPSILIEILNDEVGKKVEKLVQTNGYLFFNINDEAGTLRRVDHITKSDFWNYLLCSPETAVALGLVTDSDPLNKSFTMSL